MTNTRTTTWANIGTDISSVSDIESALTKANLNFNVEKAPLMANYNGQEIIIPKKVITLRDDTLEPLGIVGEDYNVCQNIDAFDFVNYVSGDLKFDKAGITKGGMVYVITKLPEVSILNDKFTPYVIFQNSFNGGYPVRACIAPLRIVCQNQMSIAFRNAHNTITLKHTSSLADKLLVAKKTFSEVAEYMQTLNAEAEKLATYKFTSNQFTKFVDEVLPIKEEMSELQKERVQHARDQFFRAYRQDDNANFKGTAWGAINAISDFLTHRENSRNTATANENKFVAVTFSPEILQKFYDRISVR